MESNKNGAILNSMTSVAAQIVAVVFSLFIRKYLVRLCDMELVGMNGVFNELISFLSLFELGVSASIIYRLLAPIVSDDKEKIVKLFNIIKRSYRFIGYIMIGACVLCMLLLNITISVKTVSKTYVYLAFLILAVGTISSFFVSYYRTIFVAYQRQYFCNITDLTFYVLFSGLKLLAILLVRSFLLYLFFQSIQSLCANIIIRNFCVRQYPFLITNCKIRREDKKEVFSDIKNISISRLAGYVYSATDSSIISAICGTMMAGYISNYKMVFSPLRNIINTFNTALVPTWGNYIGRNKDKRAVYRIFQIYTFFEYLLSVVLVIPALLMIDSFVDLWIGKEYQISNMITLLMGMDIYINAMQEPNVTIMNAAGYFRENKVVSELATLINIVVSIVLAYQCGAIGVFAGTIMALIVFLFGRSIVIYRKFFQFSMKEYVKYIVNQIGYLLLFLLQLFIVHRIIGMIPISGSVIRFIGLCLLCEILLFTLNIGLWRKDSKYQYIRNALKSFVKKRAIN